MKIQDIEILTDTKPYEDTHGKTPWKQTTAVSITISILPKSK